MTTKKQEILDKKCEALIKGKRWNYLQSYVRSHKPNATISDIITFYETGKI